MKDHRETKKQLIKTIKTLRQQLSNFQSGDNSDQFNNHKSSDIKLTPPTNSPNNEFEYLFNESQLVAKLGTYLLDIKTGVWTSSDMLNIIFGIDDNYIKDNNGWFQILHLDYKEELQHYFLNDVLKNKENFDKEYKIISFDDKREKWVHGLGELKFDSDGNPVSMLGTIQDITERKLSEEIIRKSEERLRTHLEQSPLGYIEFDSEFNIKEWNKSAEVIFGYTKEEILDNHGSLLIPEHLKKEFFITFNELLNFRGKKLYTYPNITKTGETIICEWYNTPLINSNGSTLGVASLVIDVTKQKQAEKSLLKSEEFSRALIENSPLGISVRNTYGKLLSVNKAWQNIWGISNAQVKEFMSIDPKELLFNDQDRYINRWIPQLEKVYKEGGQFYIPELPLTTQSSTGTKWVSQTFYSINNENNSVDHVVIITHDITERKEAEMAVIESEEKFKNIANHMFDVITTIDLSGKLLYVSPSIRRVFGYTPENLIGKNIMEFVPGDEIPHALESFDMSAQGKLVEHFPSEFIKKDNSIAKIQVNALPVYKDGEIIGAQAILHDVTEETRLQELESRAQRLEAAGSIAGQIAHDFNNLLAPMTAYPDFIREELPEGHPALEYLDDIERSAYQIADINQQLLTLGRRGHYNQEPLNLNDIIPFAIKENVKITDSLICKLDLAGDLKNMMGGNAQIYRVISNLLINASDAVHGSGKIIIKTENINLIKVSSKINQVPKGSYVKLTVKDNGYGIPEDKITKIFDPFFTLKTTDKKRGSGLGLSVVDTVVKDHDGYIDLITKEGVGTSFYIYFPITNDSVKPEEVESFLGGNESLLVVDDDNVQREVTCKLLNKLGYNITTVNSGEKAIEILKLNQFDLLILDMVMPLGIDGATTYQKALEINPDQKAIIVSGYSETDRVTKAQSFGAGEFIKKPLTQKIIAKAVRKELNRKMSECLIAEY